MTERKKQKIIQLFENKKQNNSPVGLVRELKKSVWIKNWQKINNQKINSPWNFSTIRKI